MDDQTEEKETIDRKAITINFSKSEIEILRDFDEEASNKDLKRGEYAKMLILNFDNRKRIVLDANTEAIRNRLEGKIEGLKEQVVELHTRLAEKVQQQSLQGITKAELSVSEQVKNEVAKYKQEVAHENLLKENTALTAKIAELQEEIEGLEADIEDLEEQKATQKEQLNYVEVAKQMTGPVLTTLNGITNGRFESLVSKGLGALGQSGFVPSAAPGTATYSELEMHQLNFGKSIDERFNPEEKLKLVTIIDFLYHNKGMIEETMNAIGHLSRQPHA